MSEPDYPFEELIADLDDNDPNVRRRAVLNLGVICEPRCVEPLLVRLDDPVAGVRRAVVMALGDIGDKRSTLFLLDFIDDQDADVREAVVWALSALEALECLTELRGRLSDPAAKVRRAALKSISLLKEDATNRILLSMDFDGAGFWWDPAEAIDDFRVIEAMEAMEIPETEIRERYENIAFAYSLNISWDAPPRHS